MQLVAKLHQLLAQSLGRIIPVMQMHFHLTESLSAQFCERVDALRIIFLLRIEECMAWGLTV
jgi:hypothetical protein